MPRLAQHILHATDFSRCSLKALEYALGWTKVCDADFTILHVAGNAVSLDVDEAILQAYVEEHVERARHKLQDLTAWVRQVVPHAEKRLVSGIPADQICQFAHDSHADLIVIGTHGWSGLDRVLMGSVAERVVCRAPCPVLVVRAEEDETETEGALPGLAREALIGEPSSATVSHLLVPVDFSDCSLDAVEYATQTAEWFEATVSLFHAVEPLSYSLDFNLAHPLEDRELRRKVEERLADIAGAIKKAGVEVDTLIGDKPAADSIMKALEDTKADLIVMGTHGRRGLTRLIMGSTTAKVVRRSPVPVLTVKSPKFKHGESPAHRHVAHEGG